MDSDGQIHPQMTVTWDINIQKKILKKIDKHTQVSQVITMIHYIDNKIDKITEKFRSWNRLNYINGFDVYCIVYSVLCILYCV